MPDNLARSSAESSLPWGTRPSACCCREAKSSKVRTVPDPEPLGTVRLSWFSRAWLLPAAEHPLLEQEARSWAQALLREPDSVVAVAPPGIGSTSLFCCLRTSLRAPRRAGRVFA